jgi:hypothetical protein
MKSLKNKKAAMELSIGTIVIVVLSVTMLILGLVLIRTIFSGSIDAIGQINQEVTNKISETFASESNAKIAIYPASRRISIEKGNQKGLGFAFAVRNLESTEGEFTYTVIADQPNLKEKCGINENEAESWITIGSGTFNLGAGSKQEIPELVLFQIPETAPPCQIRYNLNIQKDGETYGQSVSVYLNVLAE